jgi:hypothetical protein
MGTDLCGWLERRDADQWRGTVDLGRISGRSYDFFGALFGVRNPGYIPLAQGRGIPPDASPELRDGIIEDESLLASWVGLDEVLAIAWTPEMSWPARTVDIFHRTERAEDAPLYHFSTHYPTHLTREERKLVDSGQEVAKGRYIYRGRAYDRPLSVPDWWLELLAQIGKPEQSMRFVVYFL